MCRKPQTSDVGITLSERLLIFLTIPSAYFVSVNRALSVEISSEQAVTKSITV